MSAAPEQGEALPNVPTRVQRAPHRCAFGAPLRCTEQTSNGGWYSREWLSADAEGKPWNEKWHYEYTVLGLHSTAQPLRAEPKPKPAPVGALPEATTNRVDALLEALSEAQRVELHKLLLGGQT